MSIFEHWEAQKETLRQKLLEQPDMAGVVYQVRHAIAQTEQNALAEFSDDVLRQQAGVMLGTLKTSIGLMEAHIATQVWVPQKQAAKPKAPREIWIALLLLAALIAYCSLKGFWLGAAIGACSLIMAFVSILGRKEKAEATDEVRITLKPDADRLFIILDGQMRAIDRAVNDFAYLNEQLQRGTDGADPSSIARAADLMEALYEYEGDEHSDMKAAASRLLASIGLCAMEYSEETSRYFNALPSKNTTRTLSPAILSVKDHHLLRRGTAAVSMDAA